MAWLMPGHAAPNAGGEREVAQLTADGAGDQARPQVGPSTITAWRTIERTAGLPEVVQHLAAQQLELRTHVGDELGPEQLSSPPCSGDGERHMARTVISA